MTTRSLETIIVVVVSLVLVAGGAAAFGTAASESATISWSSPTECSTVQPDATQLFSLEVSYDLGNQNPGKITVTVSEDGYGDRDKTIDLSGYQSTDTATFDVSEYVDSSWEKVTISVHVFPEGSTTTGASDSVRFAVDGSGYSCETNPEEISGVVSVPGSDSPPPGLVVAERLSDGEIEYVEYDTGGDCAGCFEFTSNTFVEPGDFRMHFYGSDSGYPPYWGYEDVSLSDGDSEWLELERGGVYHTSMNILDDAPEDDTLRLPPGGTGDVEMTLQRPRHGSRVSVAIYIHQSGSSRSDSPSQVYDHGSVSQGPNDVSFSFAAPQAEGTYEIDLLVRTYFPDLSNSYITDVIEGPTFTVDAYEPPTITGYDPGEASVSVGMDGAKTFSVTASDPDTSSSALSYVWYVDGTRVHSGTQFEFDASEWGGGAHEVRVEVSDDSSRTRDANFSWEMTVIEAPVIDSVEPGNTEVVAGTPVDFSVSAQDPGGYNPLSYRWTIDGQTYQDQEVTHTFNEVGTHQISVEVENSRGVTTEKTYVVTITNDDPTIERSSPTSESASVRAGSAKRFVVRVANRDASPATVTMEVNGEQVASKEVSQPSRQVTFKRTFTEPGKRTVTFTVEDAHGTKASLSYDLSVKSRPPTFDSWSPESSSLSSVRSGETLSFEATATDPDGESVSYEWFIDGEYSGSGQSFSHQFNANGEYTVEVVAKDDSETAKRHEWTVVVSSFRQQPQIDAQITARSIETEGKREFVTVSFQNPGVNDRTARVELLVRPPDGITITSGKNVDESDPAQFVSYAIAEPGSQTSLSLKIAINDDSLAGRTLQIPYRIIFYPEGHPNDVSVVKNGTIPISVAGGTSSSAGDTGGSGNSSAITSTTTPGLGPLIAIGAILSCVVFLRRI